MYSTKLLVDCSYVDYGLYVQNVFEISEGAPMARALSLSDCHVLNENLSRCNFTTLVSVPVGEPLREIVINHVLVIQALLHRNIVLAFYQQTTVVTEITKLLDGHVRNNWLLPVMYAVTTDLRLIAQKAIVGNDQSGKILERTIYLLLECHKVCSKDSNRPKSKLPGLLCPVNHLLNLYFKTRKFDLCKQMVNTVEPTLKHTGSPVAQQATFRFFAGRLAVLEGDFVIANVNLTFAFKYCHPDGLRNRRRILTYLLPVKMLYGYMPPKELLEKYDLPLFWELLTAVKDGNLKDFEKITEDNRKYFEGIGLLVAIQKLTLITIRNAFKKMYLAQGSNDIAISCFQAVLQRMSPRSVDTAKTRLLISTLIHEKKMRAVISSHCNMIHFSTDNAFPRLSNMENID